MYDNCASKLILCYLLIVRFFLVVKIHCIKQLETKKIRICLFKQVLKGNKSASAVSYFELFIV